MARRDATKDSVGYEYKQQIGPGVSTTTKTSLHTDIRKRAGMDPFGSGAFAKTGRDLSRDLRDQLGIRSPKLGGAYDKALHLGTGTETRRHEQQDSLWGINIGDPSVSYSDHGYQSYAAI